MAESPDFEALERAVDEAWERRGEINETTTGILREPVESAIELLDSGVLRVAEKVDGQWVTLQWLKKAVLLSFRLQANGLMTNGGALAHAPGLGPWWDKVPGKFGDWTSGHFAEAGFRAVPGAVVRRGAYVGRNCVLMPSFVNIGAYVGEGTMVDTWATVGSCAQVGRDCHISGGTGIGGVLVSLQANPDHHRGQLLHRRRRSEVAEGVIVGEGSVISMGVFLNASTRIIDRKTGEVHRGIVPPYSVVMAGSQRLPGGADDLSVNCAIIMKTVDAQTRSKTSVNELLRD